MPPTPPASSPAGPTSWQARSLPSARKACTLPSQNHLKFHTKRVAQQATLFVWNFPSVEGVYSLSVGSESQRRNSLCVTYGKSPALCCSSLCWRVSLRAAESQPPHLR